MLLDYSSYNIHMENLIVAHEKKKTPAVVNRFLGIFVWFSEKKKLIVNILKLFTSLFLNTTTSKNHKIRVKTDEKISIDVTESFEALMFMTGPSSHKFCDTWSIEPETRRKQQNRTKFIYSYNFDSTSV